MDDIALILNRMRDAETARSQFDQMNQEIAEFILPNHANFMGYNQSPGMSRTRAIYDGYPMEAFGDGVAVFEAYVMPRGAKWQLLKCADRALMTRRDIAAWCEDKTQLLFERRNDPASGFVEQTHDSIASLLAFGGQSMWVDIRRDWRGRPEGLRYASEHIGDIAIEVNFQGNVSGTYRKMKMRAVDAVAEFGAQALRGTQVYAAAMDPSQQTKMFEFCEYLRHNRDMIEGRGDWRGRPWVRTVISMSDKIEISRGGYVTNPRTYSRLSVAGTEIYGRGRAWNVLGEMRALQAAQLNIEVADEMRCRPPLAAASDAQDMMIKYAPQQISYGLVDEVGNLLVRPLFDGADTTGMQQRQQDMRQRVAHAFYADLIRAGEDLKSHVTAAAIMERDVDKGTLLAPLQRQEGSWFSPMLDRELQCMFELGDFDDMPDELRDAGGMMAVEYDNPLNRSMGLDGARGYFNLTDQVLKIASIEPSVVKTFLREYPLSRVIPELAAISGVPARFRATDEERAAADQSEAVDAGAAQLAQLVPALGKGARDFAAAEQAGFDG